MRSLSHIHIFRFIEQFLAYFPEDGNNHCPFGPNYGGPLYPYICFLGGGKGPEGGAHGPWNDPEWGFFIPVEYVTEILGWATINRYLIHFYHPLFDKYFPGQG